MCVFVIAAPFTNMLSCPPVVCCAPPPPPSHYARFSDSWLFPVSLSHPPSHSPPRIPTLTQFTHDATCCSLTPSNPSPSSSWFIVLFSFILAIFDGLDLIHMCRQITFCSLCFDGVILKAQHTLSGAKHLFVHIIQFLQEKRNVSAYTSHLFRRLPWPDWRSWYRQAVPANPVSHSWTSGLRRVSGYV